MMHANVETAPKSRTTFMKLLIRYRTLVILIVLMTVFSLLKPVFIKPDNLLAILKNMSYVLVVGLGMTFIITLGGLDLSVGSIAAVVGVTFAMLVRGGTMAPIPALLIVLVLSMLLGFFNGFVSVKGKIEPFLVTLATMNIYRGLALTLTKGKPVPIVIPHFADIFGNGRLFGIVPTPVIISLVIFAISWFVFTQTKFGFFVRSIGGNQEASRVAGIEISKVKLAAYTMSGVYAFISGLILAALMNSGLPDVGRDLALDAISGVILGGTALLGGVGTMWGTLGGCLIIASLNNGMSLLGAQYHVQILVKGLVIIFAVLMDNAFKSRQR
ncbi:MAG TPA: ABC transporter permease [Anaerolineaceae bacterium]|nr:ABC transporter permease [Anaerolineaceae bacterium]